MDHERSGWWDTGDRYYRPFEFFYRPDRDLAQAMELRLELEVTDEKIRFMKSLREYSSGLWLWEHWFLHLEPHHICHAWLRAKGVEETG